MPPLLLVVIGALLVAYACASMLGTALRLLRQALGLGCMVVALVWLYLDYAGYLT